MTERWRFRYEGGEGAPSSSTDFPTQADAESWFAGEWSELAEQGVTAIDL